MTPASEYGDDPKCPYCGHVHRDSWEWGDAFNGGSTAECDECGREFRAVRNVSVSWRTLPMMEAPGHE
jgi:transcription elongation factor Elf1